MSLSNLIKRTGKRAILLVPPIRRIWESRNEAWTQVGELSRELNELNAAQSAQSALRSAVERETVDQRFRLRDLEKETVALKEENEYLRQKVAELYEELEAIGLVHQSLAQEAQTLRTERVELEAELSRLTEHYQTLQQLGKHMDNLVESTASNFAELSATVESHVTGMGKANEMTARRLGKRMDNLVESNASNFVGLSTSVERHLTGLETINEANAQLLHAAAQRAFSDEEDPSGSTSGVANQWLSLLETTLTGVLYSDGSINPWSNGEFDPSSRIVGNDWPKNAETMIGTARMRNLRALCERALAADVPGDFLEAGVWRGGACIYMRAILAAYNDPGRRVFVADSFCGLPEPDPEHYPADLDDEHHIFEELAVARDVVEDNFRRYGLLDDRVVFLEGWFKDTLPSAPIEQLSILRLDGDMYESTIQTLDALYHKVSTGGFVIVDDYVLPACAAAVNDFRKRHCITAEMIDAGGSAVWWQVT